MTTKVPEPALAGSATLTADACTFSATKAAVDEPAFSVTAINDSPDPAGFDLWLLHPDTSYDDWVAMARRAQETFDAGGPPGSDADLRPFADPIDLQEAVEPAKSGTLIAQAAAPGTYALQCWRFPAEGPVHLQAAGPIVVAP